MKVQINLEIEISEEESHFIRKYLMDNRDRILNIHLVASNLKHPIKLEVLKSLRDKEVLRQDDIGNLELTQLGNKVCDLFDRDLKLKKLLE